jgi:hypothetical protein
MKNVFLVLIAAAFVASGPGLLMAAGSGKPTAEEVLTELLRTNRSSPKKTTTETPRTKTQSPQPKPCVEKGCQLGTPEVVR